MSLKDEIKYVKDELSSDEKLLENAFKLEQIYKKHKIKIWGLLAVVILGFGGKALYSAYREHRLFEANKALLALQNNPDDAAAARRLAEENPALYRLYRYSVAVENRKAERLGELASSADPMLSDLSRYHAKVLKDEAGSSRYYRDLSLLEKAYIALKKGDKAQASRILAMIPENSSVARIARYLKHSTLH